MKKIRIGIMGTHRGSYFNPAILHEGGEIVAVCEKLPDRIEWMKHQLRKAGANDDIAFYNEFEEFINHEMDAVLIATPFDQHANYAIRALEKNIHVLCENLSNATMAEGVALVRAQENSKAQFMLLENYPFMKFNLELKKVIDGGTLGQILYAEGEYNHPSNPYDEKLIKLYRPFPKHWRNFLPRTYYLTHSLAPLMYISGATPKRVTAMPIYAPTERTSSNVADIASVMTTLNDDNSVFRFFGHSGFGYEENSYRFCCQNGQVENRRGNEMEIAVSYNEWSIPEGKKKVNIYNAEWEKEDEDIASIMGHFGGDFFIIREFFKVVRGQIKNPFDVYFATTLASVAILAHRSQLEKGMPYDIPDFSKEEDRKKWENDNLTPFWGVDGSASTLPCCSNPDFKPNEKAYQEYLNIIKN